MFASKVRMVLSRILTKAEKQELIKTNVVKDIVLPTVYENKHRPFTDDERRMILETIPKHYAGTMVLTMLCWGLRHTFCTDCQAAGVPINVAKEWMGHSDISVTAKIYTHMVDEVFEQNRMRMAQYAVTKSQQVESPTATN